MPQIKRLSFTDWRWLAGLSAGRTLFIVRSHLLKESGNSRDIRQPLFLLCNVQTGGNSSGSPVIDSDISERSSTGAKQHS